MKPAWKELLIAINGAFLFLLILLATEMALGHKNTGVQNNLPQQEYRAEGNTVDDRGF